MAKQTTHQRKYQRLLKISVSTLAVGILTAAPLPQPVSSFLVSTAHARGENPCGPASRGENPCAPSERGENPCAPASRGENPCAPSERGENPCAPASRGENPCAPADR